MINRENFSKFIQKYYLNGVTDSAILEIENKTIKTIFKTLDADLRGHVEAKDFNVEDARIGCYSTGPLFQLLNSIPTEEVHMSLNKGRDGFVKSIALLDSKNKMAANYACNELDLIDHDGKTSPVDTFDLKITLNNEIIEHILKGISILNSNVGFNRESRESKKNKKQIENDKIYIVFGDSKSNANSIEILMETDSEIRGNLDDMIFNKIHIKSILEANKKRFDEAYMELSGEGVLKIFFKDNDSTAEYWIKQLNREEA